jgi:peptide/nickel transport system substrate-binding protein
MAAQDLPNHKAWGEVTADLLKRLGMKVDFAAVDWGTVVARMFQKSPPDQGGWQMFPISGWGVDFVDPTNWWIRADGENALAGWPKIPEVEAEIAAWYEAKSLDEEKAIARRLNKAALDHVIYAPLGVSIRHFAWRKNVTGIAQGPLPFFWGVSKTV